MERVKLGRLALILAGTRRSRLTLKLKLKFTCGGVWILVWQTVWCGFGRSEMVWAWNRGSVLHGCVKDTTLAIVVERSNSGDSFDRPRLSHEEQHQKADLNRPLRQSQTTHKTHV